MGARRRPSVPLPRQRWSRLRALLFAGLLVGDLSACTAASRGAVHTGGPVAAAPRGGGEPGASALAQARYLAQFDTVWQRYDALYPSFAYKGVDWDAVRARYRPRMAQARSQEQAAGILREMLSTLRDQHAWLVDSRGVPVPTWRPPVATNVDLRLRDLALAPGGYAGRDGFGTSVVGGFGYLHLDHWTDDPAHQVALADALMRLRDQPGLIIDVRANAGGSDAAALAFVGRFAPSPVVASYVQVRQAPLGGPRDALAVPVLRTVAPSGDFQFVRPVVVLTGRGGLSATETFVVAMRRLPQVTVLGDTTGGSSGNPAVFPLGNGWQFSVPRWIEYTPDGQPIEGRGVPPHVVVPWRPSEYAANRDPLIDAAVGLLAERLFVYRVAAPDGPEGPRTPEGPDRR